MTNGGNRPADKTEPHRHTNKYTPYQTSQTKNDQRRQKRIQLGDRQTRLDKVRAHTS